MSKLKGKGAETLPKNDTVIIAKFNELSTFDIHEVDAIFLKDRDAFIGVDDGSVSLFYSDGGSTIIDKLPFLDMHIVDALSGVLRIPVLRVR